MGQIEDYNAVLPQMEALNNEDIKQPNIPIDIVIQEAENLHESAVKYSTELTSADLTDELIAQLIIRAGALREAQSRWQANYLAGQDAIKLWDEKAPLGYELQKKLANAFRYAYRNNKRLMGRVREILKGSSHVDMIQDLNDYAVLGKENPEELQAINFEMPVLDQSAQLSDELAELLARSNGARKDQHAFKDIRDRSYTLLKESMDHVRDCGKYVFFDEPEIKKRFTSSYYRKKNKKYDKPENDNETQD